MRPRISILNLLLVTTIVALVIVVLRLYRELDEERSLRVQLLQKGGILQVTNPNAVHVVQVSTRGVGDPLSWRVYVPEGRVVTLNARHHPAPADKEISPRLPTNAIVVAERAPTDAIELGPGEHVVTLSWERATPELTLDIVGNGRRRTRFLRPPDGSLEWLARGYLRDITHVEHTPKKAQEMRDGRTMTLQDGNTFVLCRYREQWDVQMRTAHVDDDRNQPTIEKASEVLVWLHPDGG